MKRNTKFLPLSSSDHEGLKVKLQFLYVHYILDCFCIDTVPHKPYEICPDEKGLLTAFGETVKHQNATSTEICL